MKNKINAVRQGDVLLVRVNKLSKARVLPSESGRLILARGEVTGHDHSVAMSDAALMEANGITYLDVQAAMTMLEHPEHAPIALKRGMYRVVRQREYHPQAIRNVMD